MSRLRFLATSVVFVVALVSVLFYLQYEGILIYDYVFFDKPIMRLTKDDAVRYEYDHTVESQEDERWEKAYVYQLEGRAVSAFRVLLSNPPADEVNARLSCRQVGQEEFFSETVQCQEGREEIVLSIPGGRYEMICFEIDKDHDFEAIEVYENEYYLDSHKEIPRTLNCLIAVLLAGLLSLAFAVSNIDWKSGKGLSFPVLYVMLEIAILRALLATRSWQIYSMGVEIAAYAVFAFASFALFAAYRMVIIHDTPMHKVFILFGLSMGTVMMLLIQPFTVPDETTHFYQAYIRSNELLGKSSDDIEHVIRRTDAEFVEKRDNANRYIRYTEIAEDFSFLNHQSGNETFVRDGKIGSVPLGYVASSLGITIARILNLSGTMMFYMGRFINLLAYIALVSLAIYWMPFGKTAIMVIALAPVSMQMAASYSYDPIVTSFSFLFVSYVLKLFAQFESISIRQFALCCILAVLLGPSKAVYAPLTMSVLLIPAKKFGFGKQKWAMGILIIGLAFVALFVTQVQMIARISTAETAALDDASIDYSITYLITNVRETIHLYLADFEVHADYYLRYLFSDMLGWHQLNTYDWMKTLFCILFVLGCQRSTNETDIVVTPWKRWGAIVVMIGIIMIIQLTLLMDHTPMGSGVILGVQGRYFIPFMIVCVPVLRNSHIVLDKTAHRQCTMLSMWLSVFAAVRLLQVMPQ